MQRSVYEQGAKQMFGLLVADISPTLKPEYHFSEGKQTLLQDRASNYR